MITIYMRLLLLLLLVPNTLALPLHAVSKNRFKHAKLRFGLTELVQIHHIVPREFRKHDLVREVSPIWQMERGENFMFMPSKKGMLTLNTRRFCHEGGHPAYNDYVLSQLNRIVTTPREARLQEFTQFVANLRRTLTTKPGDIPWRDH